MISDFFNTLLAGYNAIPREKLLFIAAIAAGSFFLVELFLALIIRKTEHSEKIKKKDISIALLKGTRSFLRFLIIFLALHSLNSLRPPEYQGLILLEALKTAVLYLGIIIAYSKIVKVMEKRKIEDLLQTTQGLSLFKITRRGINISVVLFIISMYIRHLRASLPETLSREIWLNGIVVLNALLLTAVLLILIDRLLPRLTDLLKQKEIHNFTAQLVKAVTLPLKLLVLGFFFLSLKSLIQGPALLVKANNLMMEFLFIGTLILLLYNILDAIIGRFSKTSEEETNTLDKTLIEMVRMLVRISFISTAVFAAIRIATGKPLTTLLAGLGIGGLAVALAAQDTLKNFFGSIMIMVDKPFKIGERIQADGFDGTVESIGFRSTRIRTLTGHQVAIPNDKVAQASIENVGRRPHIRRLTNITITYNTPPEKVEKALTIIRTILENHEGMVPDLPPRVFFNDFNAESLNILVLYWYTPADYWAFLTFSEKVNLQIMREFEAEGIEFAFPTQTTYLEQAEGKSIRLTMDNKGSTP